LKVEVIEAVKKANGWTYHVGLRDDGGRLADLGNTFVVPDDQGVSKGDTLNVICEEFVKGTDGKVFWGKPTVKGPDKSRPAYTVAQAVDVAKRAKVYKEEVAEALAELEEERGENAAEQWSKEWPNLVAKGEGRFILHGHFPALTTDEGKLGLNELLKAGKAYHSDLRLAAPGGGAWGFTVFEGDSAKEGPGGTRLADLPATKPMRGTFKLEQPGEWLRVGEGGPRTMEGVGQTGKDVAKFFKLDGGTYRLTMAREHAFEVLLNGSKVKGRYQISYVPTGEGRVWMISRPADQEKTYPEEHALDSVIKELKRKGQQWLFWRETPGARLEKIDVGKYEGGGE